MPVTTITQTFASRTGAALSGTLVMPVGEPRAVALFAHCFTCTMRSHAASRISDELARLGVATLRFDFTGLGKSGGSFGGGFAHDVEDLVAAADHLRATIGAPSLLIGHSLGGAAVLAAASLIPGVTAVATLGAPSDVAHILKTIDGDLAAIEADGSGPVAIAGQPFAISADFIRQARETDLIGAVHGLKAALLVMHSPTDQIVGIDHARLLFEAARHPKSFVSLDGADHLLTRDADARYAARLIAAWADRYLPAAEMTGLEGVSVRNSGDTLATSVMAGRHRWVADEPVTVGGADLGPTPYDLLLAALGACTAMTLRLISRREKIPLQEVIVRLAHHRNHAEDCLHSDQVGARVQAITREFELLGPLGEDQRQHLMDIANRCPVHRTLTGELHIHDSLRPSATN